MKMEEAIKLIDTHIVCFYNEIDSPTLQALHLAIEALSAEYEDYEHASLVDIKEPLKVAVVRCKDCAHFTGLNESKTWGRCNAHGRTAQDIDYCSWGEREKK